jgi:hypothetical protein
MEKLDLVECDRRLQVDPLIRAVRTFSTTGSLRDAKSAVERLMRGERVTLYFPTPEQKDAFRQVVEDLGVTCG